MATSPDYPNCKYGNFVESGVQKTSNGKGRIDLFLDKFYNDEKFLTVNGLLDVYWCIITIAGEKYEFDAGDPSERARFVARWIEASGATGKKIEFKVGIKGVVEEKTILLTKFKKTEDIFPGAASSGGGKKINKGTEFEQHFYEDATKFLGGQKGNRFIPFIKEFNDTLQKTMKEAISDIEYKDNGLTGVLDEGSKNQSRPLKFSGGGLVVSAGGVATLDMGSTLTDITFEYGEDKTPVYLSLKYGPTLTFFNSGVGGRNGPLLFTKEEIQNYNITTKGGLAFLKMFGLDTPEYINKFCESFDDYPRTKAIPNHAVSIKNYDKTAIQNLLKSGIGYGYWMVHNTKGTTIDAYQITKTYMEEAAKINNGIKVYFGRMNGKGKGVNITCESKHYSFMFNVRNKQGGKFPTHVMCDYKKKGSTPAERPERGNA